LGCGDDDAGHGQAIREVFCDYDFEIEISGDSHSANGGYADHVKRVFPDQVNNSFAYGGTTTNDWLPGGGHIAHLSLTPRVVAILLGTNDAWRTSNTPDDVVDNLRQITDYYLDSIGSCRIILSTPPPWPSSQPNLAALVITFADAIREFCSIPDDDIDCGPDLNRLLGPEHMQVDSIHLNAFGHRRFAEELIPLLEPRLIPDPL
jgi:lysophospholipase L1-like esterase